MNDKIESETVLDALTHTETRSLQLIAETLGCTPATARSKLNYLITTGKVVSERDPDTPPRIKSYKYKLTHPPSYYLTEKERNTIDEAKKAGKAPLFAALFTSANL